MAVDKERIIQPDNEVFKRKLIERGKAPSGERKTRLISDKEAPSDVPESVERHSSSLVFFSETARSSLELEAIKKKFRDIDGFTTNARGRSGGVALLWKKGLDVSLMSILLHHMDVAVQNVRCSPNWWFMGLYGYSETYNKYTTCDLLKDLKEHSHLPWLVRGDINEIFFNLKKRGRPDKQFIGCSGQLS
ncbi:hypothetical protein Cgig2_020030 [Carnegiea gigantea]|uniref:Reverse transcriptase n=1 Tax=Carnegiea gigantea TaxID=171969 RepID=A0A9Q1QAZ5_9CARY|nr:hypothetical protein Cgig2_020030 [Carnegiea gigantea]